MYFIFVKFNTLYLATYNSNLCSFFSQVICNFQRLYFSWNWFSAKFQTVYICWIYFAYKLSSPIVLTIFHSNLFPFGLVTAEETSNSVRTWVLEERSFNLFSLPVFSAYLSPKGGMFCIWICIYFFLLCFVCKSICAFAFYFAKLVVFQKITVCNFGGFRFYHSS